MKSIEVDGEVMTVLENRAEGFGATPNSTLRRILGLDPQGGRADIIKTKPDTSPSGGALMQIIESPKYAIANGQKKYLFVLSAVYKERKDHFSQILEFQYGNRLYFAKTVDEINSLGGNASAQKIPDTPFAALTNLSAKRKEKITRDILEHFKYPEDTIERVLATYPEAKRRGSSKIGH